MTTDRNPSAFSVLAGLGPVCLAVNRLGSFLTGRDVRAGHQPSPASGRRDGIAVLPLYGVIVQRPAGMENDFMITETTVFSKWLRDALIDDAIGAIVIDIDSPGGSVYGISELANEIYLARAVKPVVAIANCLAASAAYWVGASAAEFYLSPSGEVGSIGVLATHRDLSKALADAGIKTTLIRAGRHKAEGNPFEPLGRDAKNHMQSRIDDYYGSFVKAVARGRGVGIDAVRNGMGRGRLLGADTALAERMVDRVATFSQVVGIVQKRLRMPDAKFAARRLAASTGYATGARINGRSPDRLARAMRELAVLEAG